MILLKIIGKILLVPVWIVIAIAWLLVKAVVAVYSFARGIVVFGLGVLMIGTLFYYHDWKEVLFLICIYGVTFAILIAGVSIEIGLESFRTLVGKTIAA